MDFGGIFQPDMDCLFRLLPIQFAVTGINCMDKMNCDKDLYDLVVHWKPPREIWESPFLHDLEKKKQI